MRGTKQKDGVMLYVKASELQSGSAIKVESLDKLTTGSLLDLRTTTTTGSREGVVRLTANQMTSGTGMKINTNGLTTGKALHVVSTSANLQSGGSLVSIQGDAATDGNLVEVSASVMRSGSLVAKDMRGHEVRVMRSGSRDQGPEIRVMRSGGHEIRRS